MLATAVTDSEPGTVAAERLRRCIVSGRSLPRAQMIRYVVGPEPDGGTVVPDIAARLPGRGLWTEARRDIVVQAVARRSFSKAAGAAVRTPADLDDRVAELLTRRIIDFVGMARRARQAAAGFDPVCDYLERGRAGLLLIATDAAPAARARLGALAEAAGVRVASVLSADALGQVFGRPRAAQVALLRGGVAERVAAECARLAGFVAATERSTTEADGR
jgi:predicted RNA-binding protein YlxR (DUF448 family)